MHDEKDVLTSALDMPEIMLYIYSKSWKLQFSASSSIIIIEDYYLQTFLQCHLDKVFYDENSISYAVMHCKYSSVKKCRIY